MEPDDRIGPTKEEIGALFDESLAEHMEKNAPQIQKLLSTGAQDFPHSGIKPKAVKELMEAILSANSLALLDVLVVYNQRILEDSRKLLKRGVTFRG